MSRHLHKSTRTYHGRHVRAPGRVSASLRASDELPAERRLLGFPHVWRQASSKAHEYVRASAHCVRAMLVVRANGAVESAVQKVFVFQYILIIRASAAGLQLHDFAQHVQVRQLRHADPPHGWQLASWMCQGGVSDRMSRRWPTELARAIDGRPTDRERAPQISVARKGLRPGRWWS